MVGLSLRLLTFFHLITAALAQCGGPLVTTLTPGQNYDASCGTTVFMTANAAVTVSTGAQVTGFGNGNVFMRGGQADITRVGVHWEGPGDGGTATLSSAGFGQVSAGATAHITIGSAARAIVRGTATIYASVTGPIASTIEYPSALASGIGAEVTIYGNTFRAGASSYAIVRASNPDPAANVLITANAWGTVYASGAGVTAAMSAASATIYVSDYATGLMTSVPAATMIVAGVSPVVSVTGRGQVTMGNEVTGGTIYAVRGTATVGGNNVPPNTAYAIFNSASPITPTIVVQSGNAYATGISRGVVIVQSGASNVFVPVGGRGILGISATLTAPPGATVTASAGTIPLSSGPDTDGNYVYSARVANTSGMRRRNRSFLGCQDPMISCPNDKGDGIVCRLPSEELEFCGGCVGYSGRDCTDLVREDDDDRNVACQRGECVVF